MENTSNEYFEIKFIKRINSTGIEIPFNKQNLTKTTLKILNSKFLFPWQRKNEVFHFASQIN